MNELSTNPTRLYYLDWLRVIAFSILLFEHCAEIFVPWSFWVKNPDVSDALGYFILLFKPWRMPLLFMISGAAVFLSCKRKTSLEIFKERSTRILLPLLAAMLIVIPPQIYIIRLQEGYNAGFLQFYTSVFDFRWFPKGNLHWLHLWYLAFIFGFTLLVIPFLPKLRTEKAEAFFNIADSRLKHPLNLIFVGLLISLPYYFVNTFFSGSNLAQLVFYLPYFLFGLTIFTRRNIQHVLKRYSTVFFALAVVSTVILFETSFTAQSGELLVKQAVTSQESSFWIFLLQSMNTWFYVLAIFGYAINLLNFKSAGLSYANEAVYPFYILHQTVIVVIGYFVVQLDISMSWKLFSISMLSFLSVWVVYEFVIKRTMITRILFGIKVGVPAGKVAATEPVREPQLHIPSGQVNLFSEASPIESSSPKLQNISGLLEKQNDGE